MFRERKSFDMACVAATTRNHAEHVPPLASTEHTHCTPSMPCSGLLCSCDNRNSRPMYLPRTTTPVGICPDPRTAPCRGLTVNGAHSRRDVDYLAAVIDPIFQCLEHTQWAKCVDLELTADAVKVQVVEPGDGSRSRTDSRMAQRRLFTYFSTVRIPALLITKSNFTPSPSFSPSVATVASSPTSTPVMTLWTPIFDKACG